MFTTKEIVRIGLIAAVAFVLSLFKVFQMPNGGSITIYLFPLFIAASNEKVRNCLFIGIVVAILQIIMGGFVTNPLSPVFDYLIPVVAMTACGVFKQNIYVNIILGCIIALASYVLAGVMFWETPLWGSITYNATFFVPTVILNMVLFAVANVPIKKAYTQIKN